MKKYVRMAIGGVIGAALLGTVAFAAVSDTADMQGRGGFFCRGAYGTNLTPEQQQEMAPIQGKMQDLHKQMIETRKEALQKEVQFGNLTQAEADQMINRMNERSANGYGGGCGNGYGRGHGNGHHNGNNGGPCW